MAMRKLKKYTPTKFKAKNSTYAKPAVMYAVNYMYEHRTEGDFKALSLSLRSLLFNERLEMF